jgi:hypothetical protein
VHEGNSGFQDGQQAVQGGAVHWALFFLAPCPFKTPAFALFLSSNFEYSFHGFVGLLDSTLDTTTDAIRQHRSHIQRKTMPRPTLLTPIRSFPAIMAVE